MAKSNVPKQIELVYPLYLDVPMMTSFLAALEDGVAYGADVTQMRQEQKDRGVEGEGRAGVSPGILSSLFGFDIRGKITDNRSVDNNEEVKVIRKHTESSLFMGLRHRLKQKNLITNLEYLRDTSKLQKLDNSSLVEISGDISRSPLSEILEVFSRFVNITGPQAFNEQVEDETFQEFQEDADVENLDEPNAGNQNLSEIHSEQAIATGENTTNGPGEVADTGNLTIAELFERIREDLNKSRVIDVVMRPPVASNLTVVIALGLEFLQESTLETLLSGRFTVLGKVTRVLGKEEEINLYQRTVFSFIDSGVIDEPISGLSAEAGLKLSQNPSSVKAPAIQLLPLAIYV